MYICLSRPSWNGLQYNNNCETDTVQITIEQRVLLYRVAYQYITIRLTIGGPTAIDIVYRS
jgi:hypothetical protein